MGEKNLLGMGMEKHNDIRISRSFVFVIFREVFLRFVIPPYVRCALCLSPYPRLGHSQDAYPDTPCLVF